MNENEPYETTIGDFIHRSKKYVYGRPAMTREELEEEFHPEFIDELLDHGVLETKGQGNYIFLGDKELSNRVYYIGENTWVFELV